MSSNRGPNAFHLFRKNYRQQHQTRLVTLEHGEADKEIRRLWNGMSPEEKKVWKGRSEIDRDKIAIANDPLLRRMILASQLEPNFNTPRIIPGGEERKIIVTKKKMVVKKVQTSLYLRIDIHPEREDEFYLGLSLQPYELLTFPSEIGLYLKMGMSHNLTPGLLEPDKRISCYGSIILEHLDIEREEVIESGRKYYLLVYLNQLTDNSGNKNLEAIDSIYLNRKSAEEAQIKKDLANQILIQQNMIKQKLVPINNYPEDLEEAISKKKIGIISIRLNQWKIYRFR